MSNFARFAGALIVMASPAAAQAPGDGAKADLNKTDVDRIICQKQEQIGSRLAVKKVCLTAKEWRDRAQADREQTEKVQSDTRTRSGG